MREKITLTELIKFAKEKGISINVFDAIPSVQIPRLDAKARERVNYLHNNAKVLPLAIAWNGSWFWVGDGKKRRHDNPRQLILTLLHDIANGVTRPKYVQYLPVQEQQKWHKKGNRYYRDLSLDIAVLRQKFWNKIQNNPRPTDWYVAQFFFSDADSFRRFLRAKNPQYRYADNIELPGEPKHLIVNAVPYATGGKIAADTLYLALLYQNKEGDK